MKITFLGSGTSQGVPVIACDCAVCTSLDFRDKRLRSSVLVESGGKSLVIDTGPDFRQQMLRERVRRLDAVLFTHAHKDHIAGLDDVRAYNFRQQADIPLYGSSQTLGRIREEFYYAFSEVRYPGVPRLKTFPIDLNPLEVEGIRVVPIGVMHHRLPVLGFRIGGFTYITDANFIPGEEMEKIEGSQVVVLNALQREAHISHFTLSQAIALIEQLKVPQAYFTHISHRLGRHGEVEKDLPPHIRLAYDGLSISCD